MLQSLASKFLLPYLCDFFENLDSNSLNISIWTGKLNYGNLLINQKCIDKLKLPMKINKGSINSLNIEIDWKSYLSKPKPATITIDGIDLILQLLPQSQWSFDDSINYEKKLIQLRQYFIRRLSELSIHEENEKGQMNNNGYLTSMVTKLLDNIQLKITNINILIVNNDNIKTPYNVGINLKQIQVVSTNSKWEPQFIEREEEQVLFYKQFSLDQLGIFLHSGDKINNNNNNNEYILKPSSLKCNLIINKVKDIKEDNPRYSIYISLNSIDFEVRKNQYDCIIGIFNTMSLYSKFKQCSYNGRKYSYFKPREKDKKKHSIEWLRFMIGMIVKEIKYRKGLKNVFDIDNEVKEKYHNEFNEKFYDCVIKNNNSDIGKELREVIEYVQIETLYEWLNPIIVKAFEKEKDEKQRKEQQADNSWFGLFSFKWKNNYDHEGFQFAFTEEEKEELIKFIEDAHLSDKYTGKGDDYIVSLKFEFSLNSTSVTLINEKFNDQMKSSWSDIKFEGMVYGKKSKLLASMKTLEIVYLNSQGQNLITILNDSNESNIQNSQNLVDFSYESKYLNEIESKEITLKVKNQDIIYNNKLINHLILFFETKEDDTLLKENMYNKLKYMYNISSMFIKSKVQSNSTKLNIFLSQRRIIFPIKTKFTSEIEEDEIVSFSLGEVYIKTPDEEKIIISNDNKYINKLIIEISKIGFSINDKEKMPYATAQLVLSSQMQRKSNIHLGMTIGNVEVHLTPFDYKTIVNFGKNFDFKEFQRERSRIPYNEKQNAKNEMETKVFLKKGKEGIPCEYYSKLTDNFILFYYQKDQWMSNDFISLLDKCHMKKCENNTIILENKFCLYELNFNSEKDFSLWKDYIQVRLTEIQLYYKNEEKEEKKEEIDDNEITFIFNSTLESLVIGFYNETMDFKVKDFTFTFGKSEINVTISQNVKTISFSLLDTYLIDEDSLSNIQNTRNLISCSNTKDNNKKFIDITLKIINKNSDEYLLNKKALKIYINLGGIEIIFRPIKIRQIITKLKTIKEEFKDKNEIINVPLSFRKEINCITYPSYFSIEGKMEHACIVFINSKSQSLFFEMNFQKAILKANVFIDHCEISGSLSNYELFDLTNYPNTIISSKEKDLIIKQRALGSKSIAPIDFNIKLLRKECSLIKNNFTSFIDINIKDIYIIYIHQQFERITDYLTEEVILCFSSNEFIQLASGDKVIPFEKRNKMMLNIKIKNPQVIFKPNYTSNVQFVIDLGSVIINNSYSIIDKDYFVHSTQVGFNDALILADDNYSIAPAFNGYINIHNIIHINNIFLTHNQIDLRIAKISMNLRLRDYIKLMVCYYENILFDDNKNKIFYFDDFNRNYNKRNNMLEKNKEGMNKYLDFIFNLFISKINMKLLFKTNISFAKLNCGNLTFSICSYSSKEKELFASIGKMSLFENEDNEMFSPIVFFEHNDNNRNLLANGQNDIEKFVIFDNQIIKNNKGNSVVYLNFQILSNEESSLTLELEKSKFLAKFDIIYMLYIFFIVNMPIAPSSKGIKFRNFKQTIKIYSKKISVCLLTDNNYNKDQNIICTSVEQLELIFLLEDESKGRNLISLNKLDSFISSKLKINLDNLNLYIINLGIFLNEKMQKDESLVFNRRLMSNISISVEKEQICKLHQKKQEFYYETNISFNYHNNIEIHLSYRDFLNIIAIKDYEMGLLSAKRIENLSLSDISNVYPSNISENKIPNSIPNILTFKVKNPYKDITITLYNDDGETYYPFLTFSLNQIDFIFNSNEKISTFIKGIFNIKSFTYNYISSSWEPLIEDFKLSFQRTYSYENNKESFTIEDIGKKDLLINISDLAIEFLYLNLSKWNKNYKLFKKQNDTLSSKKKFSNHKVFNYTGKKLKLFNNTTQGEIDPNQFMDIDFESNNNNKLGLNLFKFEIDGYDIKQNKINIDNVQCRNIIINKYNNVNNNNNYDIRYNFFTVKVELRKLKKFIYFYSPLVFKNTTSTPIKLKLIKIPYNDIIAQLGEDESIGIPLEYFNGDIEFSPQNFLQPQKYKIYKFLNSNGISIELKEGDKYIQLHCQREYSEAKSRIIYIRYAYCIKNCLPFDLKLKLRLISREEKLIIKKGEMKYINKISASSDLIAIISIPYITSESYVLLYNSKTKKSKEKKTPDCFKLVDFHNKTIEISTLLYDEDRKMIILYSKRVLINLCGDDVKFFYGYPTSNPLPTQDQKGANIFLLNEYEEEISIKVGNSISDKINLSQLANINEIKCSNDKRPPIYNFILESKRSLLDLNLSLYSTILTLRAKYYIYNNTPYILNVSVYNNPNRFQAFPIRKKKIFNFDGEDENAMISVQLTNPNNQNDYFQWSKRFRLNDNKIHTILLYKKDRNCQTQFNLNIEKHNQEESIMVIFKEANERDAQILIDNQLNDKDVIVYQYNNKNFMKVIQPKHKCPTTWVNHQNDKIICIEVQGCSITNGLFSLKNGLINYQKLPYKKTIYKSVNDEYSIYINFEYSGYQLKITFGIYSIFNEYQNITSNYLHCLRVNITFSNISINVITDNRNLDFKNNIELYKRFELCLIKFKNIKALVEIKRERKEIYENQISLLIHSIELGNQLSENEVYYPLVLYSHNTNKEASPPLFNTIFNFQYNKIDKSTKMSLFYFSIEEFKLKVESNFIEMILNMIDNITNGTSTSITTIHPIYLNETESDTNYKSTYTIVDNNIKQREGLDCINANINNNLYIENLEISSLSIYFSFYTQPGESKLFQKSNNILVNFISKFSNVSNVDIKLNGLNSIGFIGTYTDLFNALLTHYKKHFQKNIFKILLGIDLFGNPNTIFKFISEGAHDIIKKPKEGFSKGTVEGFKGIAEGTKSLVTNTVKGVATGTSGVFSNMSKGLLRISQDEEYIQLKERQKINNKPRNFLEGLSFGMQSLTNGIVSGTKDLIKQPIQGAKDNQLKGFGKGLLKGFGGFLSKPISGALDLVSQTSEGITKGGKSIKGIEREERKLRLSRVFYGKYKTIRRYSVEDARIVNIILSSKWKEFKQMNISICEVFTFVDRDNTLKTFILTTKRIVFLDQNFNLSDYYIENKNITKIYLDRDNLIFEVDFRKDQIYLGNSENKEEIVNNIKSILKDIDENYDIQ